MATTSTLALGDIIDETLSNLYRAAERPRRVTVGSNALSASTSDVTMTLSDWTGVQPSTVLEMGSEMALVTAVSADATPSITVAREYHGTTAAAHVAGSPVDIGPIPWPRADVRRWVERFFTGPANSWIPNITSAVFNRAPALQYVELPSDTVKPLSVRHMSTVSGRIVDIAGWQFEQDLPASVMTSGKALRLPTKIQDDDDLIITYQSPWAFTDGTEAGTIDVPLGSEDLPALYAAAYGSMRREVSRAELDKIEEWNQEQAIRAGVNLRLVRDLWGEFYRRLDDARRVQEVPKHRPYRKMARI